MNGEQCQHFSLDFKRSRKGILHRNCIIYFVSIVRNTWYAKGKLLTTKYNESRGHKNWLH